jgi:hypothetical protein
VTAPGRPAQPVPDEFFGPLHVSLDVVAACEQQLVEARRDLAVVVRAALEAGASHRAVARELGVAPSSVAKLAAL